METESLQNMIIDQDEVESIAQTAEFNINANESINEISADGCPFSLSLRIASFENSADMNKFIKAVEKMVRGSNEYRMWKTYIIDILGCVQCAITGELLNEVGLEVHHHIPSLYDVVKAVTIKYLEDETEFCTFDIATRVIELHFQNKIGFVMLVKTLHEKFHNGFLSIPRRFIRGNYMAFVNEYSRYLDDEDLEKINERLSINDTNCSWFRDDYPAAAQG